MDLRKHILKQLLLIPGMPSADAKKVVEKLLAARRNGKIRFNTFKDKKPTDDIFKFREKLEAVVLHFAPYGLTLESSPEKRGLLQAAIRREGIFRKTPREIIDSIETVGKHFEKLGISIARYLDMALRYPTLFTADPQRIITKINLLFVEYKKEGMSKEEVLDKLFNGPSQLGHKVDDTMLRVDDFHASFSDRYDISKDEIYTEIQNRPNMRRSSSRVIVDNIGLFIDLHSEGIYQINNMSAESKLPMEILKVSTRPLNNSQESIIIHALAAKIKTQKTGLIPSFYTCFTNKSRAKAEREIKDYFKSNKDAEKILLDFNYADRIADFLRAQGMCA